MTPALSQGRRSIVSAALGLVLGLTGWVVFDAGRRVLALWPSIGSSYAACGIAWIVAGIAMMVGGLWTLWSVGRHKTALWITAAGSLVSGVVLVLGVLTYVIPCSGPS